MAPPEHPFPASDLPLQTQMTADSKMRKKQIRLESCELKQLTQYNCDLEYRNASDKRGEIVCRPVVRLFRQCAADGTNVETTAWEGLARERKGGEGKKMQESGGKELEKDEMVTR